MNKINSERLITVIILILGLWLLNSTIQEEHNRTKDNKRKIDSLNIELIKIDSLSKKQDTTINLYKDSIIYLSEIIENDRIKIIKIKEKYDKIRPVVVKYTNVQLDSFFTNRYGY